MIIIPEFKKEDFPAEGFPTTPITKLPTPMFNI